MCDRYHLLHFKLGYDKIMFENQKKKKIWK